MAYSTLLFAGQITLSDDNPHPISESFTANTKIREIVLQADPSNTKNILIGNATSQFLSLAAGQAISIPFFTTATIYVKRAAAGITLVNWLARD